MQEHYQPAAIEARGAENGTTSVFSTSPKTPPNPNTTASMFPYPSGSCTWGHVRNLHHRRRIEPLQTLKRLQRHAAYGWDAFGMPAENAAMKKQRRPCRLDVRQHRIHETQLKA